MELLHAKINFLGDSITEGHGVEADECFVSRIAAFLQSLPEKRSVL